MSRKSTGKGMSRGMPLELIERPRDGTIPARASAVRESAPPPRPETDSLTRGRRKELHDALAHERNRLLRSLGLLTGEEQALAESQAGESAAGGQEADVASDAIEQEIDLTLERAETRRLSEVDAALARLRAGTYGHCATCGHRIPLDRLAAIPWTRYCATCAA